jgi:hypothetical protein
MCTVTGIALGLPDAGLRVGCSRDEQRTRGLARPPEIRHEGSMTFMMPTDADRGGTWIGVNARGVLAVLLNRNAGLAPAKRVPGPSRGEVVPKLLSAATLADAHEEFRRIDHAAFAPFRVLLCDGREAVELIGGRGSPLRDNGIALGMPFVLSSSGLGDDHVQAPRRDLFDAMVAAKPSPLVQDLFHRHRWPQRPEISVNMERPDARTVSITTVEIRLRSARMRYEDLVENTAFTAVLDFERSAAWCAS